MSNRPQLKPCRAREGKVTSGRLLSAMQDSGPETSLAVRAGWHLGLVAVGNDGMFQHMTKKGKDHT